MRLVLDTNVILKALIKNSRVRAVLLNPRHQFLIPEHALEEIERHLQLIQRKTSLSENEIRLVLRTLLTNIETVPAQMVLKRWREAQKEMERIDRNDIPFVAALSVHSEGIWSDDKDLKRQDKVKVWNTREVLERA